MQSMEGGHLLKPFVNNYSQGYLKKKNRSLKTAFFIYPNYRSV